VKLNKAQALGVALCVTYSFLQNLVCALQHHKMVADFAARGVLRLNCPAASPTLPAMKKSIILVSALSILVMGLVSCASDADVDPYRARMEPSRPSYSEPAPAHISHVTGR
jgi:hypothetical protein